MHIWFKEISHFFELKKVLNMWLPLGPRGRFNEHRGPLSGHGEPLRVLHSLLCLVFLYFQKIDNFASLLQFGTCRNVETSYSISSAAWKTMFSEYDQMGTSACFSSSFQWAWRGFKELCRFLMRTFQMGKPSAPFLRNLPVLWHWC